MSENSHELLTKIMGEDFVKWGEGNISEFQRKKAKGMMSSDFPTIDEKVGTHQTMMEIEPILIALGYRTRLKTKIEDWRDRKLDRCSV